MRSRAIVALVIALVLVAHSGFVRPALAEVDGNTYTSSLLPYTVTWNDSWFVVSDLSTDFDELGLTNGLTYCYVIGIPDPTVTPDAGLAGIISGVRSDPAVSAFAPLVDGGGEVVRGSYDDHVFAAFTYSYTDVDGSVYELARYIDVQPVVLGASVLIFTCEMEEANFATERPEFEELLGGIEMEGEEPDPEPVSGEPAPVFVSGAWRIAVATTAVAPSFPELNLKQKNDKQWMIVLLDVTNWSDADTELSARDFTIEGGDGAVIGKIARSSMAALAENLGVEPFADDLTMSLTAEATVRIALAFVLPEDSSKSTLVHDALSLPLSTTLGLELEADELPGPVLPPELAAGEIVSASDGQTMRVLLDGRARAIRIQLLGVEPPAAGECADHAAERTIDDLAGAEILVEEDTAVTGGADPVRYVWLVNDDGTRTLLNQQLIADGMARAMAIPSDSRFGLWLTESERAAEEEGVGLWGDCVASEPTSDANRREPPAATPVGG